MGRSVQDFNANDVSIHTVVKDEPISNLVAFMVLPFPELDIEGICFFIVSNSHRFPSQYLPIFLIESYMAAFASVRCVDETSLAKHTNDLG